MKTIFRKGIGYLLAFGATLSVGLLAFAGMFALSPSLWLCGGAFIMAAVYEGHINHENIAQSLIRIFDFKYLQLALIRQRIRRQLKNKELEENSFLKEYKAKDQQAKKLRHDLEHHENDIKKTQLKMLENEIRKMEEDYYSRIIQIKEKNQLNNAIDDLCFDTKEPKEIFLKELNKKKKLIRVGAVFAAGGGVAAGLATLSAMHLGFAMFAITSAIPGGVLISLAVFAGVGYSLLLYRSISEMIEQYSDKVKGYFSRKTDDLGNPIESKASHIARCVLTVAGVGLAIFATIATAGTWWYAAKHGASLLAFGEKIASGLRAITVSLMALPTLIYAARNSIISAEQVSRMNPIKWLRAGAEEIRDTWHNENIFQFFNPFRMVEKIISASAKTILFLGHVVCDGLMSDRPGFVSPEVSTALTGTSAAFVEAPQIGGEHHDEEGGHNHSHESLVLKAIYFPIKVVSFFLNGFAGLWDFVSLGCKSTKASKEKYFSTDPEHSHTHADNQTHSICKKHGNDHSHNHHHSPNAAAKKVEFQARDTDLQANTLFKKQPLIDAGRPNFQHSVIPGKTV